MIIIMFYIQARILKIKIKRLISAFGTGSARARRDQPPGGVFGCAYNEYAPRVRTHMCGEMIDIYENLYTASTRMQNMQTFSCAAGAIALRACVHIPRSTTLSIRLWKYARAGAGASPAEIAVYN